MIKKTLVTALAVAGATLGSQAMAWEEGALSIYIKSDKGYDGLQAVADRFTADTGIAVTVSSPEGHEAKFEQEAAIGQGADIMIHAHDRFGGWAQSGLIAPIEPGKDVMKALDSSFWQATSFQGAIYGYPIAIEGPTQICNADIVKKPFKTLADVRKAAPGLAEQGKKALMWDYNNAYFSYGFLTSEGGYVFKNVDGSLDVTDVGVNNAGAIAGFQAIKDLIDDGIMPAGVDYGVFDSAFIAGDVACVINGPWAWQGYKDAGIEIMIAPYPKVTKSGSPRAFTGILSAAINAASTNKDLAVEFIEYYLLTEEGLKTVNDDKTLGGVTHKKFMKTVSKGNETLADAFKVWQTSDPMPNVPEITLYWSNIGDAALPAITSGRQTVTEALNDAQARMTK